jgi:hypothetical protein
MGPRAGKTDHEASNWQRETFPATVVSRGTADIDRLLKEIHKIEERQMQTVVTEDSKAG